jgi:hypothetical protein
MRTDVSLLQSGAFLRVFHHLLPSYLPGRDTGATIFATKRDCWIDTVDRLMHAIAHESGVPVHLEATAHADQGRQIRARFTLQGHTMLFLQSGFGSRPELEACMQELMLVKAELKVLIYSCLDYHQLVLDQLNAALYRYSDHVLGERYLAVNLQGAHRRSLVSGVLVGADLRPKFSPFQPETWTWNAA